MTIIKIIGVVILGGIGLSALVGVIRGIFLRDIKRIGVAISSGFVGLLIGAGIFVLFWFGFAFSEPPERFGSALKAGDEDAAYALLTEGLQSDFDGRDGMMDWSKRMQPESWFFWGSCGVDNAGIIEGSGKLSSGEGYNIRFSVRKVDDEWLIQGIEWEGESFHRLGKIVYVDCSD